MHVTRDRNKLHGTTTAVGSAIAASQQYEELTK